MKINYFKKHYLLVMILSLLFTSNWNIIAQAAKKQTIGPGVDFLGGTKITMLENQSAGQMMSFVIETRNGNLIVIDGGRDVDAEHLLSTLTTKGGHVSAWLITHVHADHVGALNYILKRPDHGLTIDHIYHSIPEASWHQENDPSNMDMVYAMQSSLATLPQEKVHSDITKGYEINVDEVKVTVMNQAYRCSSDPGNNASVVYKVQANGKTAIFMGDLSEEGGDRLMADYSASELKCDIVQMAHHGQNGVKESVYQAMRPSICLWPTPSWLWNNDNGGGIGSGPWRTAETREWMQSLGVTNHYSIKDGDQIIR